MLEIQMDSQKFEFSSIEELARFLGKRSDIDPKITIKVIYRGEDGEETFMSISVDLSHQDIITAFNAALTRIGNKLKNLPKNGFVEDRKTFNA
jgi:hypothetical protein